MQLESAAFPVLTPLPEPVFQFLLMKFPAIVKARSLPVLSPLTTPPPLAIPVSSRYRIEGDWSDVERHLSRLAIAAPNRSRKTDKDPWSAPSVRILNDVELIEQIYSRDPETEIFSRWVLEPDILVIRAGKRHTSNAELPNAILEAFSLREVDRVGQPLITVLTYEPWLPWSRHVAYSKSLDMYLTTRCESVDIMPGQ